jgi:hypothetical protein
MRANRIPASYDPAIAAMSREAFVDAVDAAHRARNREQFIILGQRLVWGVVHGTTQWKRLAPYRDDLYTVGVVALIEHYDRGRPGITHPFWYYRKVVKYRLLDWCHAERILRRKDSQTPLIVFDADLSARSESGESFIANVAGATVEPPAASDESTAAEVPELTPAASRPKQRPKRKPVKFDPTETATPQELHDRGMSWKAVGELLGVSQGAAYNGARKSPQVLRDQAMQSRIWRTLARQRHERLHSAGRGACVGECACRRTKAAASTTRAANGRST